MTQLDQYQIDNIRQIRNDVMSMTEALAILRADSQQLSIQVNTLLTLPANIVAAKMPGIEAESTRIHNAIFDLVKVRL